MFISIYNAKEKGVVMVIGSLLSRSANILYIDTIQISDRLNR